MQNDNTDSENIWDFVDRIDAAEKAGHPLNDEEKTFLHDWIAAVKAPHIVAALLKRVYNVYLEPEQLEAVSDLLRIATASGMSQAHGAHQKKQAIHPDDWAFMVSRGRVGDEPKLEDGYVTFLSQYLPPIQFLQAVYHIGVMDEVIEDVEFSENLTPAARTLIASGMLNPKSKNADEANAEAERILDQISKGKSPNEADEYEA